MARRIISGDPGTTYTNDTGRTLYQLIVNWHYSCALCISFDHQVGPAWPIPFHRACRCRMIPVLPDATSRPFVDYRAKILTVSEPQRTAIMGKANLAMVESGLVAWSDVVTPTRVRSLREVASRKGLTVDQMTRAGVSPGVAREAYDAVHAGTHTAAEVRRHLAVQSLLAKGYTPSQVRESAAGALAQRLTAAGPSGPSSPNPLPLTPRPVAARTAAMRGTPGTPGLAPLDPRAARLAGRLRDRIKALAIRLGILQPDPEGDAS